MNAELQQRLDALITATFERWGQNATEEQKQASLQEINEYKNDPAKAEEMKQMMIDKFNEADADSDGYLTTEQYISWSRARMAARAAKGIWVDMTDELFQGYAEVCNALEPDTPGISLANIYTLMGASKAKSDELTAAAEAAMAQ